MSTPPRCLIVGVDGSVTARHALSWAYVMAGALAARLVVVHAVGLLEGAGLRATVEPANLVSEVDAEVRAEGAPGVAAPSDVATRLEPGTPPDVLLRIAASEGADLVVVGSRGLGGTSLALGSTSEAVLSRSTVPVVVLPAAAG